MHLTTHAFQLGEPVEHRGIVVTPLFPTVDPVAAYITLDEALPRGLRITETSDAGSVPELAVVNPLERERPPLRRRGARRREAEPDPQRDRARRRRLEAADPGLVRRAGPLVALLALLRRGVAHLPRAPAPPQGARCLAATAARAGRRAERGLGRDRREAAAACGVDSPTAANRDTFDAYADRLRELEDAFPLQPGQCGAVLAIGDDLCLDAVSRPDVFARLWPKLRAGYLLDALEGSTAGPRRERIAGFLDEVAERRRHPRALGRARRGRPPARHGRDRLRPRARRRAHPAQCLHVRGERRSPCLRAHRAAERAALSRAAGLSRRRAACSWRAPSGMPRRRMSASRARGSGRRGRPPCRPRSAALVNPGAIVQPNRAQPPPGDELACLPRARGHDALDTTSARTTSPPRTTSSLEPSGWSRTSRIGSPA